MWKEKKIKKTNFVITADSILIALFILTAVVNADMTLTVNGLDTLEPVTVVGDVDIIIEVAGQTSELKESYSVTCEMGGKLELMSEPNALAENARENEYLFTFDEGVDFAEVYLTTDGVLDYQLVLFKIKIPETQTIIFGVDSDAVGVEPEPEPEPKPEPNQPVEPNEPQSSPFEPTQGKPNELVISTFFQNANEPPTPPVNCPNDVNSYQLYAFSAPDNFQVNSEQVFNVPTQNEDNFGDSGFPLFVETTYVELQEITSSQFLDPELIYYIPYPPLLIHGLDGEEIDVVIPSDTTIVLAEDWDYGIVIYDGANVYFGDPAPDSTEPDDIQPPGDTNNPVEPVWIVGESGNPFFNNYCGILVDRTAGTRCLLNNIYLSGFQYGIFADQQLEYPISNIYSLGCYNGIFSFGSNKIMNSYVSYFGVWSSGWQYYGQAYCFIPESYG